MQAQRRLCDQQEEPNGLQGVPAAQVPPRGDVQEWFPLRSQVQLVQDPLPVAGAADHDGRRRRGIRRQWVRWRSE